MMLGLLRRQHAAFDQGIDLRRHRMVGVQPFELAGAHEIEGRIADTDPAHLVAADMRRHDSGAHAVEIGFAECPQADRLVGILQAIGETAALLDGQDEGVDCEPARDRPAGVPAHAVGHDGQQRAVTQRGQCPAVFLVGPFALMLAALAPPLRRHA